MGVVGAGTVGGTDGATVAGPPAGRAGLAFFRASSRSFSLASLVELRSSSFALCVVSRAASFANFVASRAAWFASRTWASAARHASRAVSSPVFAALAAARSVLHFATAASCRASLSVFVCSRSASFFALVDVREASACCLAASRFALVFSLTSDRPEALAPGTMRTTDERAMMETAVRLIRLRVCVFMYLASTPRVSNVCASCENRSIVLVTRRCA